MITRPASVPHLALTALCLSFVSQATAASILITNNSFEAVALNPGGYSPNDIPGWTASTITSSYRPTAGQMPGGVPDGTNIAAVGGGNTIFQTLSTSLAASMQYTLQVSIGERSDILSEGYLVSLYAGSTLLASDASQTLISGSFVTSTVSYFADVSDPNLGQALKVVLSAVGSDFHQTDFDNVRLDASAGAPEPGTLAMLALAGVVLSWKGYRK